MKKRSPARPSASSDIAWLSHVREVRHALDPIHPLRVQNRRILDGGPLPRPSLPHPERHPYCEINFAMEGRWTQLIGMDRFERSPGDLMLIGPGTPHFATIHDYPNRGIVVHFLPVLLFELSPTEGARLLSRFTAPRHSHQRVVRPPKELSQAFVAQFTAMADEYAQPRIGSDLMIRSLLMNALVALVRWEESVGQLEIEEREVANWEKVEKVLRFIYSHYTERLYIGRIAQEAGLPPHRLHRLFHAAFGMGCIQYLRGYRIAQAMALLRQPGARVTEVAAKVGFDTLSHFNASFHEFQGQSPRAYMKGEPPRQSPRPKIKSARPD